MGHQQMSCKERDAVKDEKTESPEGVPRTEQKKSPGEQYRPESENGEKVDQCDKPCKEKRVADVQKKESDVEQHKAEKKKDPGGFGIP